MGTALLLLNACKKSESNSGWQPSSGELKIALHSASKEIRQQEYLEFHFEGYSDSILIYDGTVGHEYKYRNRTILEGVKPFLSFSSYRQWGAQEKTLSLLVSKDFEGKNYDATEINKATWVDITDRVSLSTGTDNTSSGRVDLSDLVSNGGNLYFAFHFVGSAESTQRTWTIKNFDLKNELSNGSIQRITTTGAAEWKQYSFKNSKQVWSFNNTQLQMVGGNETATENDDWVISKAFNFNSVIRDSWSHLIKSRFQNMVPSYRIGYAKAGNYSLTVVGKDAKGKELKKETYNITIYENE